jgi:hypothetical protein
MATENRGKSGAGRAAQIAVVVLTLFGAAGLGRLTLTASPPPPEPTTAAAIRVGSHEQASDDALAVKPGPLIRPLELLATAGALEPLFSAGPNGEPVLAGAYQSLVARDAAAQPGREARASSDCVLFSAVQRRLTERHMSLTTVIATLPDWVDSSLKWTFDTEVDALQAAAAQLGYVSTVFDLPETSAPVGPGAAPDAGYRLPRLHETTPGALLFRSVPAGQSQDVKLLLILIVGETPTAGVHHRALTAAIQFVQLWHATEQFTRAGAPPSPCQWTALDGRTAPLKILGPTYSGSAASLRMVLEDTVGPLQSRAPQVSPTSPPPVLADIVTPSASSLTNRDILTAVGTRFRSVTHSDGEVLRALAGYLRSTDAGWGCGEGAALLVEANTTWGRQFLQNGSSSQSDCDQCKRGEQTRSPLSCAVLVPFPIHISKLRSDPKSAAAGNADPTTLRSQTVLDLADQTAPADRIPAVTPELTGASVELMIGGMFRAIERRDIKAIGILATDKRDHIYLAQQIAHRRPNVLSFTIESNLIYLHPEVVGYLRGTLVASTYSLDERSQQMTRPHLANRFPQQFGSSAAHGVFNALAMLMDQQSVMLDYDMPAGPGQRVATDSSTGPCRPPEDDVPKKCTPAVWISIAGQEMLLPVSAARGIDDHYAAPAGDSSEGALVELPAQGETAGGRHNHSLIGARWPLTAFVSAVAICGLLFLVYWMARKRVNVQQALEDIEKESRAQGAAPPAAARTPWSPQHARNAAKALLSRCPALVKHWLRPLPDALSPRTPGTARTARELARGARREIRASELAILGSGIVFGLWSFKLLVIYWAAAVDHALQRWSALQLVFSGLCCVAGAYFWYVLADAFWLRRPGESRRRTLMVAPFAVYALAVAAWAIVPDLVRLKVLPFSWPTSEIAAAWSVRIALAAAIVALFTNPSVQWSRILFREAEFLRRVPVLFGFGAVTCLVANMTLRHWTAVGALLFSDRGTDLSSLVSPSVVILGLSVTLAWWAIWNLRRVDLLMLPEIEVGVGAFLDDATQHCDECASDALRSPSLSVGKGMLGPIAIAGIALAFGNSNVGTIEGRAFNGFLLLGNACLLTALAHTLAHTRALGGCALELLAVLRRHPAAWVFAKLSAEPFDWGVTYRAVRGSDLQSVAARIAKIGAAMEFLSQPDAKVIGDAGAQSIDIAALCRTVSVTLLAGEGKVTGRDVVGRTKWIEIDGLLRTFVTVLRKTRWQASYAFSSPTASLDAALAEMEFVVVFHASIVLRDVFTRIITGFTAVFGGLLILLLTNLLYTFQGRIFWLGLNAVAIVVAGVVAIALLLRLETDTIFSQLWGTTPGQVSLVGGLAPRIVAFALAALVTVLTVFFPEVVGDLPSWLTPISKLLH